MNKQTREFVNSLAGLVSPIIAKRHDSDRPIDKVPGLSVRNATEDTAELMVYGTIGGGGWFDEGISASDMAAALAGITAGRINVRINSGGGDCFDGVAIYTQLMRHPAYIATHNDGLAGSAASVILMAGDEVVSTEAGITMIHDASTYTYGNPADHRESAEILDKISDAITMIYANRAGEDTDYWRARMNAPGGNGTWYTSQEAYDAGLIDKIERMDDDDEPAMRVRNALRRARLDAPEKVAALLAAHPEKSPNTPEAPVVVENDDYRYRMSMAHWINTH